MNSTLEVVDKVTILFAGDSGDGIQLTGNQFTNTTALHGNDLSTFPDFPAEIRAPIGTLAGVSGFQINFGSTEIFTPGDACDVLVVMNAAALKKNIGRLKARGVVIANESGFDARNLKLAGFGPNDDPLDEVMLKGFQCIKMDVTKQTRTCLAESGLGTKERDRSKNMFVLGYIYWMYDRDLEPTLKFLKSKFGKRPEILDANIQVLKAGYHFAETNEEFRTRYEVKPAKMQPGRYRNIMGNEATAIGLIAASKLSKLKLFYGTYPITPASDILHHLAKHKNFGVQSFQAEDEIAAVCAAIGASFGGDLGVTATSGPGVALKTEAIGLAMMLELPLLIINVQRGGPSTGLPTKTEQADLLQAMYGRNGEAPVPVVAASTPSDCFDAVIEAARIAIEYMTPVFFLSDGYIANGAAPWKFPNSSDLKPIQVSQLKEAKENFQPYERDERLVRSWAIPGVAGMEHRLGGLEKEDVTGHVSYDPDNHQHMVETRAAKIEGIDVPDIVLDQGKEGAEVLILGWGSTYGSIKTAVAELLASGYSVAHAHLRHINPFPKNLGSLLKASKHVLVPEMNMGQLVKLVRDKYLVDAQSYTKVKGVPFESLEIANKVKEILN